METKELKKRKNLFQGLTKRQKRILFGSGAVILGILFIIIIIYLCSGGKRKQSDLVTKKALGDASEATSTSDFKAAEAAGRSLQVKIHAPNTSSGVASQEETEVDKETETQTAKVPKIPTITEPLKTDVEPPKPVVNPLQTCEDYQIALAKALKTSNEVADLEALFVKVKELCEGPHQDLTQYVKQHFDARKAEIFASEMPIYSDLTELQATQNHLKQLNNTYKPVKSLEQEFCEHFGPRFTTPFGKVESNPDIPEGKDCALEARKHFHAARTFCANYGPMKHPAYEHIVLENYLIAKIKELSNPVHAGIMKYIRILRHLRPNSPYAFTGCDDLAAVQIKLAEGIKEPPKPDGKIKTALVVPFKDIDIRSGPLSIETIKALDDIQLNSLIENQQMKEFWAKGLDDSHAVFSNMKLLGLAKLAREMGGTALLWMNSGFGISQSITFQNFASEQLNIDDQSNLMKAMGLAASYHSGKSNYLELCGFSDDANGNKLEESLASYLSEAFQHSDPTVRQKILHFASIDNIKEVVGFVDFVVDHDDLPYMAPFFYECQHYQHSAIYRLIIARLEERNIPKVVPGVNMNAPKNAKGWYNHIAGHLSDKIQPVLDVARNQYEILAAKNEFLNRPKSEHFDDVFRTGSVLWSLKCRINDEVQPFMKFVGITDVKAAFDDMESYRDSNFTFYKLLEKNKKAIELSLHGFDSEYAAEDVKRAIKRRKELIKLDKLYKDVSSIILHFAKENPGCFMQSDNSPIYIAGCVLQSDGSIACQNTYVQNKLRELEQDTAWEGHDLFKQFLNEARNKKKSSAEIRALAFTFLAAKMDSCSKEKNNLDEMYGTTLYNTFVF